MFSHCSYWSDKKHITKRMWRTSIPPEEIWSTLSKWELLPRSILERGGGGVNSSWDENTVQLKQIYFFSGDYVYCALMFSSLLWSLGLFSATIHTMAPGSPEESQRKQLHRCSRWNISIQFKIRSKSLLKKQRKTKRWSLKNTENVFSRWRSIYASINM